MSVDIITPHTTSSYASVFFSKTASAINNILNKINVSLTIRNKREIEELYHASIGEEYYGEYTNLPKEKANNYCQNFASTSDPTKVVVSIPVVPFARYFEYFQILLSSRWSKEKIMVVDLPEEELLKLNYILSSYSYIEEVEKLFSFFQALPRAYLHVRYHVLNERKIVLPDKESVNRIAHLVKEAYNVDSSTTTPNDYFFVLYQHCIQREEDILAYYWLPSNPVSALRNHIDWTYDQDEDIDEWWIDKILELYGTNLKLSISRCSIVIQEHEVDYINDENQQLIRSLIKYLRSNLSALSTVVHLFGKAGCYLECLAEIIFMMVRKSDRDSVRETIKKLEDEIDLCVVHELKELMSFVVKNIDVEMVEKINTQLHPNGLCSILQMDEVKENCEYINKVLDILIARMELLDEI